MTNPNAHAKKSHHSQVAAVNAVLFLASIAGFMVILIHNAIGRAAVIKTAKALPIPGCPVVHTGIEWAQWVPATIYEGILFGYALWKTPGRLFRHFLADDRRSVNTGKTLYNLVLQDNLLYFFGYDVLYNFATKRMLKLIE
jgi:hypothetical protein